MSTLGSTVPAPSTKRSQPRGADLSNGMATRRTKVIDTVARAATVSHPQHPKAGPSRGLKLEIDGDMSQYGSPMRSAPARTVRRRLPEPPLPAAAVLQKPAIAALPAAPAPRPLPKPPVLVTVEETPKALPARTGPRASRPLPTPSVNIPKPIVDASPPVPISISLPSLIPASQPPAPSIPSPSVIATFPRMDAPTQRKHRISASVKIPKIKAKARAASPVKIPTSRSQPDLHIDVVQLHRQLVLNRSPPQSPESDSDSDEEFSLETYSTTMVFRATPEIHRKEEIRATHKAEDSDAGHADYAWLLSNRILYQQKKPESRIMSKWMREKNGKRYTEEDFGNIIDALRSL